MGRGSHRIARSSQAKGARVNTDLHDAIERHRRGPWSPTAVPRLTLVSIEKPIGQADQIYEPMICFVARGSKNSVAGDLRWRTRAGDVLLNSLAMPVTAMFEELPYRSAVLQLDARVLSELLLELGPSVPVTADPPDARNSMTMTPEIVDAVTRLVRLLDTPDDIPALAGRVEGEILYRLLASPLGPALRHWARTDTAAARIRAVASWIIGHHAEPLSIDGLAAIAHMSPASLHRHFKAATGMSPLRFQKQLRLQEARRRLVAGDLTAAEVAAAVGYASATQFNREYRRFYGLPPVQDTIRLRAG